MTMPSHAVALAPWALAATVDASTMIPSADSDHELQAAWAAGDLEAGRLLYSRHARHVAVAVARSAGDDTSEFVQRAFLALIAAQRRGVAVSNVRAYLCTVARRELRHDVRARRRVLRPPGSDDAACATSPSTRIAADERHAALRTALAALRTGDREVLELHYGHGLRVDDIAERLRLGYEATLSRLHRARNRLRALLDGRRVRT